MPKANQPKQRIVFPSTPINGKSLTQPSQKPPKKKSRGGLCGMIVVIAFIALIASIFSSHSNASPVATPTPNTSLTQDAQLSASYATQLAQTPLVQPTHTPTLKPTPKVQSTHQIVQPTAKPTQPPVHIGVNGNPWGYDFNTGSLIYNPPADFCNYFNCISSFWNGSGFVNECSDGTYSLSGGHSGDCSHHGGEWRPLYRH